METPNDLVENNVNDKVTQTCKIDNYECSICKELLYRPVTLICQHSYCYDCIETYYFANENQDDVYYDNSRNYKCPLCNIPYTLPPIENVPLSEILEVCFPEEYNIRREYIKNINARKELKNKEEKQIRKEIWNILSTDFSFHNQDPYMDPNFPYLPESILESETVYPNNNKSRWKKIVPIVIFIMAGTASGFIAGKYI